MAKFSLPFGKREPGTGKPADFHPVDLTALEAFAAGARTAAASLDAPDALPWAGYDRHAPAKITLSIRVNDYHLAMIRHLAEQGDTTQNRLLRRLLLPEIEARALRDRPVPAEPAAED
ncbi:MAG: hypothetical protein WCF18_21795 [Chthoniobacteraceae bacterium]